MTIELPADIEESLRDLAARQGRDLRVLVEEAVRDYVEAVHITDLTSAEVAEAQLALLGDLEGIPDWKDDRDPERLAGGERTASTGGAAILQRVEALKERFGGGFDFEPARLNFKPEDPFARK
jgi:predicted transcriptional regulator